MKKEPTDQMKKDGFIPDWASEITIVDDPVTHCRVPIRYTCSSFMFPSCETKDTLTNIYVKVPQLTWHDKFMVWLDLRFPRLFKLYYRLFIRKNILPTLTHY